MATSETKLIVRTTGALASPLDADDSLENANGFEFVRVEQLRSRVDEYGDARGPIAFITPSQTAAEVRCLKTKLSKDWPGKIFPIIERRGIMLYNKIEAKVIKKDVTILNINQDNVIDAVLKLVAALTMQANPKMQLSVAVLEPICYDLGLESSYPASGCLGKVANHQMPCFVSSCCVQGMF